MKLKVKYTFMLLPFVLVGVATWWSHFDRMTLLQAEASAFGGVMALAGWFLLMAYSVSKMKTR